MLVEPGIEAHVDVVQRAEGAGEVEALLPERAPEALDLSACGRVVRARVNQRRAEPFAGQTQSLAAVGRAIVEV